MNFNDTWLVFTNIVLNLVLIVFLVKTIRTEKKWFDVWKKRPLSSKKIEIASRLRGLSETVSYSFKRIEEDSFIINQREFDRLLDQEPIYICYGAREMIEKNILLAKTKKEILDLLPEAIGYLSLDVTSYIYNILDFIDQVQNNIALLERQLFINKEDQINTKYSPELNEEQRFSVRKSYYYLKGWGQFYPPTSEQAFEDNAELSWFIRKALKEEGIK